MDIEQVKDWGRKVLREIGKVIINQSEAKRDLLVSALSDGHVELESVPGLGKTMLLKMFATAVGGGFSRIQFTPDLMPLDIIGTDELDRATGAFEYREGPVFANFVLADEINRTPPKTQSALLEAMEERHVTAGGVTRPVPSPFLVVATQNPLEQEGTYPLPEAQLDRFMMRIVMGYPSPEDELTMMETHGRKTESPHAQQVSSLQELLLLQKIVEGVYVDPKIREYMRDIVVATRPENGSTEYSRYIKVGASPRASLALERGSRAVAALEGRIYVLPQDVVAIAPSVLNHRLSLDYSATADGLGAHELSRLIAEGVAEPKVSADLTHEAIAAQNK